MYRLMVLHLVCNAMDTDQPWRTLSNNDKLCLFLIVWFEFILCISAHTNFIVICFFLNFVTLSSFVPVAKLLLHNTNEYYNFLWGNHCWVCMSIGYLNIFTCIVELYCCKLEYKFSGRYKINSLLFMILWEYIDLLFRFKREVSI